MISFKIIADTQKEMIALDEAIYSDDHWFDKLDEKAFSINHKALQLPERSREGSRKHQAVTETLKAAKPLEKQRFMEKRKAAAYEAANLRI